MDTRVAVISIIVENPAAIEELNHYLHEAGEYIIGRMGIPSPLSAPASFRARAFSPAVRIPPAHNTFCP